MQFKIQRMKSAGFSNDPTRYKRQYTHTYTRRFRNGGEVRTCLVCDIREIRLPRGLYASANCRQFEGRL